MTAIRVIGVGNLMAGDDAAGLLAARRLRTRLNEGVGVFEAGTRALDVLDLMAGAQVVFLVDAVRSGRPPGAVQRLDAGTGPIAAVASASSTHALSALEALELGRVLGLLPARVIVYGIEAGTLRTGAGLPPAVAEAVDAVAARVAAEAAELARA
jgi:hydrogenase maturation protease